MAKIIQYLPWLKHSVGLIKVVKSISLSKDCYRWLLLTAVCKHQVLLEGGSQRNVGVLLQIIAINDILDNITQTLITVLANRYKFKYGELTISE